MSTIHALVAAARARLVEAGLAPAEAELDARLLLQHLLGWDTTHYLTHGDQPADAELHARYALLINRRVQREPVAYITGVQEFWGRPFAVSPGVLIPRPETELIVEQALDRRRTSGPLRRIADVCTGSGCLAVTLALEEPAATVIATDIDPAAIAVARRNVARSGVEARVRLVRTDLLGGVHQRFDLIVANPPYVPTGEGLQMQPEVVRHEPHVALFAGDDGLVVIRRLVAEAVTHLNDGGDLLFEFGYGQAEAVTTIVNGTPGLQLIALHKDLQGIPRTAAARRIVE